MNTEYVKFKVIYGRTHLMSKISQKPTEKQIFFFLVGTHCMLLND